MFKGIVRRGFVIFICVCFMCFENEGMSEFAELLHDIVSLEMRRFVVENCIFTLMSLVFTKFYKCEGIN